MILPRVHSGKIRYMRARSIAFAQNLKEAAALCESNHCIPLISYISSLTSAPTRASFMKPINSLSFLFPSLKVSTPRPRTAISSGDRQSVECVHGLTLLAMILHAKCVWQVDRHAWRRTLSRIPLGQSSCCKRLI
jgi:hypothetical protein